MNLKVDTTILYKKEQKWYLFLTTVIHNRKKYLTICVPNQKEQCTFCQKDKDSVFHCHCRNFCLQFRITGELKGSIALTLNLKRRGKFITAYKSYVISYNNCFLPRYVWSYSCHTFVQVRLCDFIFCTTCRPKVRLEHLVSSGFGALQIVIIITIVYTLIWKLLAWLDSNYRETHILL